MGKLNDKYYDAVVVSDEIDPNHGGAVRALIKGVTDTLKPDEQPFVLPGVNSMQAVPTKGTLMRVAFDDGDIQKGKYFQTSPEPRYLPEEYVSDYPNVSVTNLGGDFFQLTHNRRTKESRITHPSNSQVTWTSTGALIHNSDKGYNNAGRGAINTQGTRIHSVLTEATIDPFTCTPVGNNIVNGGAYQGSEYMFVTHMSSAVADSINGKSNNDFDTVEDREPSKEVGGSELETRDLYDASGDVIGSVPFYPIESYIDVVDKEITRIIIDKSDSDDFLESAGRITDGGNDMGVHYLIGRVEGTPPVDSEREGTDEDKQKGFIQFVDTTNDVHYMSEAKTVNGDQANDGAVVIMLSGTGSSFTTYQYETISKLVAHIRYEAKNVGIPIIPVSPDVLIAIPPVEGIGNLDGTRIV
jgi:hypothetical protein